MTVRSLRFRTDRSGLPSGMYTPGRSIISPKLAFATDRWLLRNAIAYVVRERLDGCDVVFADPDNGL